MHAHSLHCEGPQLRFRGSVLLVPCLPPIDELDYIDIGNGIGNGDSNRNENMDDNGIGNGNSNRNENMDGNGIVQTLQCNVSADHEPSGNPIKNEKMARISPKSGSISTIIRSYKSAVSKNARKINPDFAWQSRFHDRIIRDAIAFQNIQNYIEKNPEKWANDSLK